MLVDKTHDWIRSHDRILHEAKPRLIVTFGGEIEANRHFWSRRFARLIGILIEAIVRLALCKSEASREMHGGASAAVRGRPLVLGVREICTCVGGGS